MKSEKKSKLVFNHVVEDYVASALLALGFMRNKFSIFYKWNEDCLWRISCYYRDIRGADEGYLQTSVCVGFKSIHAFLSGCPEVPMDTDVKRPCTMGANIGHLRPPYNTDYVHLTPEVDGDKVGVFLLGDIRSNALPYFEKFGTLGKAVDAWEKGILYNSKGVGVYLLAAAYFLRGETAKALEVTEEAIAKEQRQVAAGPAPIGRLTEAEIDLVGKLDLQFDSMAKQELRCLLSFKQFLLRQAAMLSHG